MGQERLWGLLHLQGIFGTLLTSPPSHENIIVSPLYKQPQRLKGSNMSAA